jgi:hypothetical protein
MKARRWTMWHGVWRMIVSGGVGLLLLSGTGGAQVAGDDLTACQLSLEACEAGNAVLPGSGVDGPPLTYTDNGDGTITDNNTLLMWEKKVAGGDSDRTCLTDLHGVDSECTWEQATGAWIAAINAANLGGHNDWRVPNVKELQSIVDYSKRFPGPTVTSDFPGLTGGDDYWTSTTLAGNSIYVRSVNFGDGGVNGDVKSFLLRVRAVRGGR